MMTVDDKPKALGKTPTTRVFFQQLRNKYKKKCTKEKKMKQKSFVVFL